MRAKEAVAVVKSFIGNPDATVVSCKNYKTDFLITAFEDPDDLDPFYLVDKVNGFTRKYSIADDPDRYYNTPDIDIS